MIWPYGGQEKLKGGRVLISFFLNGLLLEDKSMSLLMEDFINHVHLLEVQLGFYKYADGGPIMDVPVERCVDSFQRNINIFGGCRATRYT
jgi:hypothetical protein